MRRRRNGEMGILGMMIVWAAGAVTIYLGSFHVPGVTIRTGEGGSFERVELDWENTLGERVFGREH